jgi:hypothetical protein
VSLLAFHDETFRLVVSFTRDCKRYRSLARLCIIHTFLEIEHAWINCSLGSRRTAHLDGALNNCAGVGFVVTCGRPWDASAPGAVASKWATQQRPQLRFMRLLGESNPPAHFFLGTDVLSFITTKIDTLQAETGRGTHVTTSTDATHSGHWVGRGERRPQPERLQTLTAT